MLSDRNTVTALNGSRVLLREGDPIDLDQDGQFDDNVFIGRANPANAAFQANGVQFANDGTVHTLVNIRDADGLEKPPPPSEAGCLALRAAMGVPLCHPDYNQDGGGGWACGADVEAFFLAWEVSETCADVNQDGGIDCADVETFFIGRESGSC